MSDTNETWTGYGGDSREINLSGAGANGAPGASLTLYGSKGVLPDEIDAPNHMAAAGDRSISEALVIGPDGTEYHQEVRLGVTPIAEVTGNEALDTGGRQLSLDVAYAHQTGEHSASLALSANITVDLNPAQVQELRGALGNVESVMSGDGDGI